MYQWYLYVVYKTLKRDTEISVKNPIILSNYLQQNGVTRMLRFAASPTGDMLISELRVAILNYLLAQQRTEGFIIRIDDTDKASNIEGKDTEIMQILEKFALIHESVFHQSEHLHMHQTLAIKLLEEGKAFVCTCTQSPLTDTPYSGRCYDVDKSEHAKLKESGTPFVIRIKKPATDSVYQDYIQGNINTTANDIDSFIILNTDGTPTPIFASACDDMLSGITMLIREESNLLDTVRQIHIKTQLGFDAEIRYAHIPALNADKEIPTVKSLFEQGFIPDAIINYLLLLANEKVPQEIFTLPETIEWFKLDEMSTSTLTFDLEKLRFINREHLRRMDDKQLSSLFGFADADIGKLAKLYLEEASTTTELEAKINPIFVDKNFEGPWANQMRTMETLVQDAPMFAEYEAFEAYVIKESGLTGKNFFIPLRLLLTGAEHGPELSDIYPLIKSYLLEIAS